MKVVLLAGGLGTRISEETVVKPKPMVEIGGMPILWHIMKIYSAAGFNDFVVCLGYKGYVIKEFFSNYFLHKSNVSFDFQAQSVKYHDSQVEPWRVTLIDTGQDTLTGGRIKRVAPYLSNEPFLLTYGDGLSDVDLNQLVNTHKSAGKLCTVTAVQPSGRFGALNIDGHNNVTSFAEKPKGDGSWINGGFFVCEPGVLSYIKDDQSIWEKDPLENMAKDGQLHAFHHNGFWKPMDTLRDKTELEQDWQNNRAQWKSW